MNNVIMQILLIGVPLFLGLWILMSCVLNNVWRSLLIVSSVFAAATLMGLYISYITNTFLVK